MYHTLHRFVDSHDHLFHSKCASGPAPDIRAGRTQIYSIVDLENDRHVRFQIRHLQFGRATTTIAASLANPHTCTNRCNQYTQTAEAHTIILKHTSQKRGCGNHHHQQQPRRKRPIETHHGTACSSSSSSTTAAATASTTAAATCSPPARPVPPAPATAT